MEPMERTPFGKRLFDAREAAKLTQKQAAKKVGMAQSTLAEAEISGKRSGYTPQLAELYGVSAKWLATGNGESPAASPPAIAIKPPSRHETRIAEIVALLRQTDMEGLAVILDRAKDAARDYPIVKQTPLSSQ